MYLKYVNVFNHFIVSNSPVFAPICRHLFFGDEKLTFSLLDALAD
jgi:hypothetical protein